MDEFFSSDSSTLVDNDASTRYDSPQLVATIKVTDDEILQQQTPPCTQAPDFDKTPTNVTPIASSSLSNLPSPLLCPRRAFLASLILASKFNQDRCYSNRAWAKLSGLPAREIGRCERALGDALDWRLWVGKKQPSRSLSRCQSEGGLLGMESKVRPARSSFTPLPLPPLPSIVAHTSTSKLSGGLRRTRTAPAIDLLPPPPPSLRFSAPEPALLLTSSQHPSSSFTAPYSPISPVPSLSHSPSSTESSGGDQTIQIVSYFDDPSFTCLSTLPSANPSSNLNHSWSWSATPLPKKSQSMLVIDPEIENFLSKAMMDGVTGSGGTIPEPMVGVVQDGLSTVGGGYCGQDEGFSTHNGTNPGMVWDHSLVY
jgi:hypothetical protein